MCSSFLNLGKAMPPTTFLTSGTAGEVPRGATYNVLDHGYIRLVDFMGNDLSIIRAARASFDASWRAGENERSDDRLLERLWTGGPAGTPHGPSPKHSTPFESVTATFEVKAPIFVFRQWHRHRTQSYNELSLRYQETPEDHFYLPDLETIGVQSADNKQGRALDPEQLEQARGARFVQRERFRETCAAAFHRYHKLLEAGWPRELARCVLPMGTYSKMWSTGNLLNFMRFLTLRADVHAQYEIRVYAEAMVQLFDWVVPKAMTHWRIGNQR